MAMCVKWAQRLARPGAASVVLATARRPTKPPATFLRRPAPAVSSKPLSPATAAGRRLFHGTAMVRTDASATTAAPPPRRRKWRWWVAGSLTAALAGTAAVQYKVITEYERGLLKENPALEHPANPLSVHRLPLRKNERLEDEMS